MNQFRRSSAEEAIDPQAALQAARQVIRQAEAEGKKAAVAGGLAMQVFGFTRATSDVDVVASDSLSLTSRRFGPNKTCNRCSWRRTSESKGKGASQGRNGVRTIFSPNACALLPWLGPILGLASRPRPAYDSFCRNICTSEQTTPLGIRRLETARFVDQQTPF